MSRITNKVIKKKKKENRAGNPWTLLPTREMKVHTLYECKYADKC